MPPLDTLLDNIWSRFRTLSAGKKLLLWIFLFWILIPILIWRTSWSKGLKSGATIAFAVLLIAVVASGEDPGSTGISSELGSDAQGEEEVNESDDVEVAEDVSDDESDSESSDDGESEKNPAPGRLAFVTRVIDGDTIEVDLGGRTVDVRLIGVDTPETVHPSKPVQCLGPAASEFTRRNLEGKKVRLEFDVQRRDRYQRTLAYAWLGQKLFNETLVAKGFARVSTFPPNVKYEHRFLKAQREARKRDKGLWGSCTKEEPASPAGNDSSGGSESDQESGCTPGYSPCLPPASDYDCAGGSGDGPEYATGPIQVTGSDPYQLDSDGDGVGCE